MQSPHGYRANERVHKTVKDYNRRDNKRLIEEELNVSTQEEEE